MITSGGERIIRSDLIRTKLKEIEDSLSLISENLPGEVDKFLELGIVKDGIYKRVEFCIESALDVCSILNSDLKLGIPSSEDDIIQNLVRKRVISPEMGKKLKLMKGFRNILVHRYGKITDELAFESIASGMDDFRMFIREVERAIKTCKKTAQERRTKDDRRS